MGRSIVAEETVQKTIEWLYETENKWMLGLIIGQSTLQKDYVIHISKTPPAEDESAGDISLEMASEKWLANHAKQVLRMLPGGQDILGIFVVADPNETKSAQAKLRQMLFAVFKAISKNQLIPQIEGMSTDKILLHICPVTRKLTCRTYDIADHKCSAKPAEWKFQRYSDRFHTLHTKLALEVCIPVSHPVMDHSALNKQIQTGIKSTCSSIWNAIGTVNYLLCSDGETLESLSQTQKQKPSKKESTTGQSVQIDLLIQNPKHSSYNKESTCSECGAKMLLRGTIQGRAFVHPKATVKEAIQALKLDVIRSLVSRCELLCEDLLQTEEEQDPKVLYETPLRVFGKYPDLCISFCDYMFPDESSQDLIDRCDELLGLRLEEENLDKDCERMPNEDDEVKPTCTKTIEAQISETENGDSSSLTAWIGAAVTIGVGTIAVAMSYLYLDQV